MKRDKRRKIWVPKKELKRLYKQENWAIREIADHFDCSKNTISYWLRRYDIKLRTPSKSMSLFINKPEIKISKEELYNLFVIKKIKLSEIAKKYNCSISTVISRIRRYKIANRFSNWKRIKVNKEDLKRLYLEKKLDTYEIADIYGCCQSFIWKKLKLYKIRRRAPHDLNSKIPSKGLLIKLYIKNKLSTWQIEKKYGYSRSTVHKKLKEYGIKIRNRAESHIIYPKKDFGGDLAEKAYLIGFRIGDLRVRKIWENSETIHVDCGSSKIEQIRLIRHLFKNYGGIWIKRNKNRGDYFQIEAYLNQSFSFLLDNQIPSWISKNKRGFFSFLAGFSDAEGYIKIYKNKAIFGIGNYNSNLLFVIWKSLNQYGIACTKPREYDTSNYFNKEGYGHNQNYWQFRVHKKDSLIKLFGEIEPFIKHKQKIKDLNKAKENVISRSKEFKI